MLAEIGYFKSEIFYETGKTVNDILKIYQLNFLITLKCFPIECNIFYLYLYNIYIYFTAKLQFM